MAEGNHRRRVIELQLDCREATPPTGKALPVAEARGSDQHPWRQDPAISGGTVATAAIACSVVPSAAATLTTALVARPTAATA